MFGKTTEGHNASLLAVLHRLEEKGLSINKEKSEFYKNELTFYGLRFTPQSVSPTESRVKAIHEAAAPEDAKALRSFLCSITWSSRFMRDICTIAVEWTWGQKEQAAFDGLKRAISSQCVGYFNKDGVPCWSWTQAQWV